MLVLQLLLLQLFDVLFSFLIISSLLGCSHLALSAEVLILDLLYLRKYVTYIFIDS
jgi:hypothetical protein